MDTSALRRLLKLQEADMRLKDMEMRLETLPKEMNNLIAQRDKIAASTAAAVTAVSYLVIGDFRSCDFNVGILANNAYCATAAVCCLVVTDFTVDNG